MVKAGGWKGILKADPTNWLLDDENPVVRFWTLRDLVGASEEKVEAARKSAIRSEVVREVFRLQKPEGHWQGSHNMHSPHYKSTIYQLTLLGDMGLTAEDGRVTKGVEAVLKTQREDGGFPGHDPRRCAYGPYDIGLIVRFMHQFGVGDDPRVGLMYEWIEENQTPEGGWIGVKVASRLPRGCLNSTVNVLWGLAITKIFIQRKVARKGVDFLTRVMRSPKLRWETSKFSYPQFWNFWIDDIKLAEIYLGLGLRRRNRSLKGTLNNILALQGNDGRWLEQNGSYPVRALSKFFPRKGQPSKWVSAKAMITLKRAYG
jgi:hypothetical protein